MTVVTGGLPILELGIIRAYDVTRDGQRFLSVAPAATARSGALSTQEIEIVLNWSEELKRLVPTN